VISSTEEGYVEDVAPTRSGTPTMTASGPGQVQVHLALQNKPSTKRFSNSINRLEEIGGRIPSQVAIEILVLWHADLVHAHEELKRDLEQSLLKLRSECAEYTMAVMAKHDGDRMHNTERWLAPIQPHFQHLAAANSTGTSLEASLQHITTTPVTWDALEEEMAEVSTERHGRAKQLVVFFGAAGIGTGGGWGAHAVLRACCKPINGKGKAQGKAAKAKPAPQPGRWLGRDCNAALNMQRIGESRWRPLQLCWWPEQAALPAKGKEYPELGYKRRQDWSPKAHQQLVEAQ
ncbi:hypothetical protein QJQ45_008664, partial [Haematococcus lacustris]